MKAAREARGWRPEDLAREAGVAAMTVRLYEAGRRTERGLRPDMARKLAAALNLNPER